MSKHGKTKTVSPRKLTKLVKIMYRIQDTSGLTPWESTLTTRKRSTSSGSVSCNQPLSSGMALAIRDDRNRECEKTDQVSVMELSLSTNTKSIGEFRLI